jgi:hypothetical protein
MNDTMFCNDCWILEGEDWFDLNALPQSTFTPIEFPVTPQVDTAQTIAANETLPRS